MNETAKTKALLDKGILEILKGSGIDIGCGNDPVTESVAKFDVLEGDANQITKYVTKQFDFVWSSHCLEHMNDPYKALAEWWRLVKDYGHLLFIVPDEDLYEQGHFPSRFNDDHKHTFTISKNKSWSPVSINVLELVASLPGAKKLIKLELQDNKYDRRLLFHNLSNGERYNDAFVSSIRKHWPNYLVDQTATHDAVAQILCVLQKVPDR